MIGNQKANTAEQKIREPFGTAEEVRDRINKSDRAHNRSVEGIASYGKVTLWRVSGLLRLLYSYSYSSSPTPDWTSRAVEDEDEGRRTSRSRSRRKRTVSSLGQETRPRFHRING